MPLTIAHPAVILPFKRSRLPIDALIVGSLAPDFEYLLYLAPRSEFSHTVFGLFAFCLPTGLLALWIFECIWKRPLLYMLGKEKAARINRFVFGPVPRFLLICCGLLIGSVMHILWDSFTHSYGWLVQHHAALRQDVHVGSLVLPRYVILQHISTILGIAVLLFLSLYHRTWHLPPFKDHIALIVIVGWLTIAGGVALGMLVAGDVSTTEGLMRWPGCACVVGTTIMCLVTTFFCILWHIHHRIPGSLI